jgi:hypothetical protein
MLLDDSSAGCQMRVEGEGEPCTVTGVSIGSRRTSVGLTPSMWMMSRAVTSLQ